MTSFFAQLNALPAWAQMWLLALGIYAFCKVGTWWEAGGWQAPVWLSLGYLMAWPGMDARTFLAGTNDEVSAPDKLTWLAAAGKFLLGVGLLIVAVEFLPTTQPWLRAWIGMAGIVFTLHFGIFHLLACWWRARGVRAVSIMQSPVLSQSLVDFWSRRWNLAFRDLTHRFVFRPLASRLGGAAALWIGFLLSGLIHDAVVSLPARGGYGWPTLFFLIQAAGMTIERSRGGRRLGLGRGLRGWLFAATVLLLPSPLLFHQPFCNRVVIPFLDALGDLLR